MTVVAVVHVAPEECAMHGMHQDCEHMAGTYVGLVEPTDHIGRHPPVFTFGVLEFAGSVVDLQRQLWQTLGKPFAITTYPFQWR